MRATLLRVESESFPRPSKEAAALLVGRLAHRASAAIMALRCSCRLVA